MYIPSPTGRFKRDLRLCAKRGYNISLIDNVMTLLCETGTLPLVYSPHPLHGIFKGRYECHITPDWLLIWRISGNEIVFVSTGTHSDLFD
ncbi:mRNA interferase YafQ [Bacteroidales bacterium Barb4]|nr:mRNA interferase YafQ [Bacteroidales bacterium Barb4]